MDIIDQLVTQPLSTESMESISPAFKKALIERPLGAEMPPPWATGQVPASPPTMATTAPAPRRF